MTTTRPEHTELYVVEADTHEWPPMVAAARALEHEGNDAAAVEEFGGDLVIEILSPSTADRDLGYKHDLYGRHGVLEYWVVDPMTKTGAVHRQQDGELELTGAFGRRDTLRTPLLKGLALQLDDIFPA